MENSKNEIDLVDVLKSFGVGIWNLIKKCVFGVGWYIRLVFQEKILVLSFVVVGILLGLFVSRVKVYRAEVELKINAHDSYFYKNMIDPLFNLCKYRDVKSIAADLGIPYDKAEKIINIQSFHYVDVLEDGMPDYVDYDGLYNPLDTNSSIMTDRLRLLVDCTDTEMFEEMDKSFIYFFSQNPQIVKENELRMKQLNEKISATSKEIVMLDSLRRREYFVRKRDVQLSTDKMVVVEREIKLYHNELLALEDLKQQFVWQRDVFEDGVSFSSHFEPNPHPINNWLKSIMMFAALFFFLGSFVALFKVKINSILRYLRKEV